MAEHDVMIVMIVKDCNDDNDSHAAYLRMSYFLHSKGCASNILRSLLVEIWVVYDLGPQGRRWPLGNMILVFVSNGI